MRWDFSNLRLHQSRLVIANVLQQRAQTQIILTDNDSHATGEQWRQIFWRTYVFVSLKKIDKKKMSNEKYFKVKTKFLSQTMKFIKRISETSPENEFFWERMLFSRMNYIEEEWASSTSSKPSVLPYRSYFFQLWILCRCFSFSSVVPYH